MKTRKTKDIFILTWNKEEVDRAESKKDAIYLQQEYNMAFNGGVTIKKRRERL